MESKHEIPEVPDLYRLAFMPGVFKCPQCDFQLSKQTMNPSAGIIGVSESDRETEECPNDGTMMVPVTYREQLAAYESRLFQELDAKDALQSQLSEARSQIEVLEESLEAQTKKYEDCPHPKPLDAYDKPTACACSYDRASDVCALHAPQLKAAQQKYAALEAKYQNVARMLANAVIAARASRTQSRQGAPMSERSAGE